MRWPAFVLGGIAIAVVGIVGWQVWETEQLKVPKWIDTDRADCQTWDPYPQRDESVTWTGDCRSGIDSYRVQVQVLWATWDGFVGNTILPEMSTHSEAVQADGDAGWVKLRC